MMKSVALLDSVPQDEDFVLVGNLSDFDAQDDEDDCLGDNDSYDYCDDLSLSSNHQTITSTSNPLQVVRENFFSEQPSDSSHGENSLDSSTVQHDVIGAQICVYKETSQKDQNSIGFSEQPNQSDAHTSNMGNEPQEASNGYSHQVDKLEKPADALQPRDSNPDKHHGNGCLIVEPLLGLQQDFLNDDALILGTSSQKSGTQKSTHTRRGHETLSQSANEYRCVSNSRDYNDENPRASSLISLRSSYDFPLDSFHGPKNTADEEEQYWQSQCCNITKKGKHLSRSQRRKQRRMAKKKAAAAAVALGQLTLRAPSTISFPNLNYSHSPPKRKVIPSRIRVANIAVALSEDLSGPQQDCFRQISAFMNKKNR